MNSNTRNQSQEPKKLKGSEISGKKFPPQVKPMTATAKLMADFYGVKQNKTLQKEY
jgi:hypothetical protein